MIKLVTLKSIIVYFQGRNLLIKLLLSTPCNGVAEIYFELSYSIDEYSELNSILNYNVCVACIFFSVSVYEN